jgi:hypothetical protein
MLYLGVYLGHPATGGQKFIIDPKNAFFWHVNAAWLFEKQTFRRNEAPSSTG